MSEKQSNEERLHGLLCATLLGEASPEERAEVERALEASPELRAERERLEATIGLVRGTLADPEALSEGATAELVAAANRGRMRALPWYRSGAFRAAASLLVVAGSWAGYSAWRTGSEGVARAPAADANTSDLLTANARKSQSNAAGGFEKREGERALRSERLEAAGRAGGTAGEADSSLARKKNREQGGRDDAPFEFSADSFGVTGVPEPAVESLYAGVEAAGEAGAGGGGSYKGPGDSAGVNVQLGAKVQLDELALLQRDAERGFVGAVTTTGGDATGAPSLGFDGAVPVLPGQTAGRFTQSPALGSAPQGTPGPASPGPSSSPAPSRPNGGVSAPTSPAPPASARSRAAPATEPIPAVERRIIGRDFDADAGDNEEPALLDGPVALEDLRALGYVEEADGEAKDGADDFYLGRGVHQRLQRRAAPTPEQLEEYLSRWKQYCRRRPNEQPRDMFFRFWGDNSFETTALDRLSTFSVDVDTASYALARRYLRDGHLPEKAQIRTEEFLNYFKPDLAAPTESTFAIYPELAPSLFNDRTDAWMLRVGIRGKEVSREERQPLALTFVIDVSGSMKEQNRLELVKHSLRLLLSELDGRDAISIVAFSKEARLVLPMTSASSRGLIESAIHPLAPNGGTNAEAGLKMGYEQALSALTRGAHNRVVLLSDGVANIGQTDQTRINDDVSRHRQSGIYLNTIGVGMNNHNDTFLEQLANKGDGLCNYVDDEKEARRALVENFTGAFEPIARDVKVQVDFDPAQVQSYRLLGYENRAIADADFRNDAVDAGEVGAGHQVVALYEVIRTGSAGSEEPFAKVHLRWKAPHAQGVATAGGDEATEISKTVSAQDAAGSFAATGAGYRRSVLAAQFAEFLRRSFHARNDSLDRLIEEAQKLGKETKDEDTAELVTLIERSKALLLERHKRYGRYERLLDDYSHNCYLQARIEAHRFDGEGGSVEELERRNAEIEKEIRELLQQRWQQR